MSKSRVSREALAQAIYPWLSDPGVALVWYSRAVYVLCVAIAAFGHKECLMISELVGIQSFFSLVGLNRPSRYTTDSRLLRTVASGVLGIAFSAFLTLSLFCFEEINWLVAFVTGGALRFDRVFYLSVAMFMILIATWLRVARLSNRMERAAD